MTDDKPLRITIALREEAHCFKVEEREDGAESIVLFMCLTKSVAQSFCANIVSKINTKQFKLIYYNSESVVYEPKSEVEWFKIRDC